MDVHGLMGRVFASEPKAKVPHCQNSAPLMKMRYDDSDPNFSDLASPRAKKITWATAGLATDPGRYMFRFGWLTITADDLAIWQAYPNAAFTLIRTLASPAEPDEETVGEEFRLGTFDLRMAWTYSTGEK